MVDSTEALMTEEETTAGMTAARKIMTANRIIIRERTGIKTDTLTSMAITLVMPIIAGEAITPLLFMDGPRSDTARLLALAPSAMRRHLIMHIPKRVSGRLNRGSYTSKKTILPGKLANPRPISGITAQTRQVTIPR
jgi:hypothetical protein